MRLRFVWLWVVVFIISVPGAEAQLRQSTALSNLRHKIIAVATDSLILDSLSIAPGTFHVEGVSDTSYAFYPERSLLVWKTRPAADSVRISYRVLPLALSHIYFHKQQPRKDSVYVSMIYRPGEENINKEFVHFNQLEYNGSYGRSITLGNNQDVVLNSQFNLQVNGYILDSIKLEAAITDNTIPFQPEGNTQRLQEFDQIYIRLSKNNHLLQLGDYNLESPPGYFLKFFKRVQGIYYENKFPVSKSVTNALGVSGSVAKGQFARNIFQGQEGNQGPYKLTGNNGELFFIVLAATERVYIDNVLMERGENADYVINYNTAEVRFMPRRMITKDSRIQVEFEYQDRNYLNSLIYAWDELKIGKKWDLRLNVYSNQDAKNQPYLQNLSGDQKRFLGQIGDSIQNAFYPNIVADTFAAGKILYKMIDTVVNSVLYDSVFVYSTDPDSAQFSLAFSYVGIGKGDYTISTSNANGRVYDWVAPINGVKQGDYAPVQLLVTPKRQQVFILTNNYRIDSLKNLNVELGVSNYDPNLFSTIDNQTHTGLATRVNYTETRFLGTIDSLKKRTWQWQNNLSYEYVQDRFRAIAPYRNVEFGRDWNVPQLGNKPDEHLADVSTRLTHKNAGSLLYRGSMYRRGEEYNGLRNILGYDIANTRVRAGFVGNVLQATDTFQTTAFYRPSVCGEYLLKELKQTYIGGKYELEHNEVKAKHVDSLLPTAFSFDVITAYLRNAETQPMRWNLTYFTRRDRVVNDNEFKAQNHSNNLSAKLGFSQWRNHLFNFTGTYRKLVVDDSTLSNLEDEESLLGRMEYTGNYLKQAVSLNSLYEFGSGQEQKRSYTYVEVPAGQGMYTWNDYNNDGVQQANEFEIALYPDQKRFIRVFSPTNEYVKVNYVNFNFSLTLDPSYYWQGADMKPWQKWLSRFSSQSSLQISNRLLADEGSRAYNPFVDVLRDGSIILTNSALSNSIFFNRNSAKWGLDYNLLYNTGKQLLVYGVEGSQSQQHLYRLRWNIVAPLTLNLAARHGNRGYQSALQDNRTYDIHNFSGEPSVSWLHRSVLRITGTLRYEQKKNAAQYGGELATIQGMNMEVRYSRPAYGVVNFRGSYANIEYSGVVTSSVAFIMLEALQRGSNFTWGVNWERRIGKGIEISLEYEGRKPGIGNTIHTGRMSVRAIL